MPSPIRTVRPSAGAWPLVTGAPGGGPPAGGPAVAGFGPPDACPRWRLIPVGVTGGGVAPIVGTADCWSTTPPGSRPREKPATGAWGGPPLTDSLPSPARPPRPREKPAAGAFSRPPADLFLPRPDRPSARSAGRSLAER